MKTLEICTGDPEGIQTAFEAGANRIELCSGLAEGGLTPSVAIIRFASELKKGSVNVLIRPRAGDFVYTPDEVKVMTDDIRSAMAAGAQGCSRSHCIGIQAAERWGSSSSEGLSP